VSKQRIAEHLRDLLGDAPFADEPGIVLPPDITVTGPEGDSPFSKGVLAQSLLAAALEPAEAFEVAREIERAILALGNREIDRDVLRNLTREALHDQIGSQAAQRYLIWREQQESGRPLLLLLGGTAGVGKTSIALEVAHRLGIGRVLSTDSIRQIMRIMLSRELVPALHASSFDAWKSMGVEKPNEKDVIDAFRAQAGTVSVGVRGSLDRAVAENTSLVLDGVSIVPGLIDLDAYGEAADVIFIVVATLDETALATRFQARGTEARDRPPHRYVEHLASILRVQDHLLELADRHVVPIVDNISLDASVTFVIRHVLETLDKRKNLDGDGLVA
jgi:2-phosphoglycerate kinase